MTTTVDLIVLGTGTVAQSVAYPCREAGWSVAVVDYHPFGGTCQLRGCDPKKVLVGVSDLVDWSRRMQGKGVSAPGLSLSWPDLIRFKRTFTDPVPEQTKRSFEQAGIITQGGRAHFVDRTSVQVGEEILVGRHVVIAIGACHADLGIPGEDLLTTSTQFLDLEELPRRIVFVGGGYIAFEFAHIAARAGAQVQVLHRGSRPLAKFDPDLVSMLVQASRELGIEVHVNRAVTAIERQGDHLLVHARAGAQEHTVEADLVVHAAGRAPEIDKLDLEVAGVVREKEGVSVNEYLQSVTNPAMYAAGDAVASGGFPLPWVDLVIRHPEPTYRNGRPAWLHTPDRCVVQGRIVPPASSFIQLHLAQEGPAGTPVDQYLTKEDGAFELLAPQGAYLLRWWSPDERVIGERPVTLHTWRCEIDLPLA